MMRSALKLQWSTVAVALLLLAACGKPEAPVAQAPPAAKAKPGDWASPGGAAMQGRGAASPEEAMFVEKCSMCHREMGMGTVILARRLPAAKAPLEGRDDLTADFIRIAVRSGVGNMPRISRGEVSDEQLEVIARHLLKAGTP